MISAEEFLAVLEQKDLLPAKMLESLKGQVGRSARPIAADAVAKLLVEKGILTPAMARRLLSTAPKTPGRVEQRPRPKPAAGPKKAAQDEDFGLAPLEDPTRLAPVDESEGLVPLEDAAGLVPLDESEGLVPLDEPDGLVPLDEPTGLAPLEDLSSLDDLTFRDESPAPPAAQRPPAAARSSAPAAGSPASAKRPQAKPAQAPAARATPAAAAKPAATKPAERPSTAAPAGAPSRAGKQPGAPAAPATNRPSAAPPAAGGSLLEEEVPESSAGAALGPLDALTSADAAALAGPLAAPEKRKKKEGTEKKKRSKKSWDSALMLVGGGSLLGFLLLGGVLLWWFSRQGADEILIQANDDYHKGSYTQAIFKYDAFLQKYPKHPGASLARVHRGLAEMRQATDGTSDWARSLETADRVLKKISSEAEFRNESQAELVSLLPAIAQGLAGAAEKSLDQATVDRARKTLAMVEKFIPSSGRPATRLADIEAMLALTQRQIDRGKELDKAVAGMNAAVGRGKNADAYQIRDALLKQYPSLAADAKLQAAVHAVSQAERAAVKRFEAERAAQTTEPTGRIVVSVALASRTNRSEPPGCQGRVIFVQAEGAVYGLDAATGKVLWRRWAGVAASDRAPAFPPTAVDDRPTSDALLVDAADRALVRVEAATGRLRWRHPLGERFDAYPVITQNQVLVAARSGRLVSIDLESGKSPGYVQIPQPLRVAPAVEPRGSTIYQVAEHSNLYVLSSETGRAREVVYLGHAPGSIVTPPVLVSHFLIVAENDRAAESRLRVLNVAGSRSEPLQEVRLQGHVVTPLVVSDLRLLVVTDTGGLGVFDVSGSNPKQPLVQVGEGVVATDSAPSSGGPASLVRFPFLLGVQVLMADSQVTRYDVQSSRDRLQPTGIQDDGSTTLQPLVAIGQTVFHVRRKDGMRGVLVSALSAEDKPCWETGLANPLAGEPLVDAKTGQVTAVTAAGTCFQLGAAALKDGAMIDQPAAALPPAEVRRPVSDVVALEGGLLALAASDARQIAVFRGPGVLARAKDSGPTAAADPSKTPDPFIRLTLPDPLACRPVSFAGGLLAPTKGGQVLLLDPVSGANRAEPFQPRLESGVSLAWREPAVLGPDDFALTDGRTNLYRVTVKTQPKPYLAVADTAKTPEPVVAPLAAVRGVVYAADVHTLTAYELPTLSRGKQWPLSGRPVWGPRRIGQHVLLATDDDQLYCLTADQKLLWRVTMAHGPLAGTPAESGGRYVLASMAGTVWTIDAESGKEVSADELGRPLGCGPVAYAGQLLLTGRDGTLYLVGPEKP
jgi:outer membrane protein assembly factor BamB